MRRILILGGTAEARALAGRLAAGGDVTLSLAGRTERAAPQPVPVRVGGFGGAEGLARHLVEGGVGLLVDATHPFATTISANAVAAARLAGIDRLALVRPPWRPQPGDRWTEADDVAGAVAALGARPRCVLAAIGRQEAHALLAAPQHRWLVRSVDPVEPPLALPDVRYVLDRGPFTAEAEIALFRGHAIDAVLAKNSGGPTGAKLEAARALGIEVAMVRRPPPPEGPTVADIDAAVAMVEAWRRHGTLRGV